MVLRGIYIRTEGWMNRCFFFFPLSLSPSANKPTVVDDWQTSTRGKVKKQQNILPPVCMCKCVCSIYGQQLVSCQSVRLRVCPTIPTSPSYSGKYRNIQIHNFKDVSFRFSMNGFAKAWHRECKNGKEATCLKVWVPSKVGRSERSQSLFCLPFPSLLLCLTDASGLRTNSLLSTHPYHFACMLSLCFYCSTYYIHTLMSLIKLISLDQFRLNWANITGGRDETREEAGEKKNCSGLSLFCKEHIALWGLEKKANTSHQTSLLLLEWEMTASVGRERRGDGNTMSPNSRSFSTTIVLDRLSAWFATCWLAGCY